MKKHPEYGIQVLKCGAGLQPEMIDIVAHHHEYLDGSGYPHGLQAHEISDLVRITTVCESTARWSRSAPTSRRCPARGPTS